MLDRRNFMKTCSGMGLAGTLFPGVLWAQAQGAKKITREMIENAAAIADVPIGDGYKEMMLENLNDQAKGYEEIYKLHIPNSVVTLTEERARAQAKKADEEIAAGKYRGPLHGMPWGAKDLLATKGYRTTWGAAGFESQMIEEDATVVKRLDEAGAVLVAKLTLGALALGDVWFGGVTRNPWNTNQGSSGSSAG